MQGAHAAWYLKNDVETQRIPICAISSHFSAEAAREQPHAHHLDCFLPKPSDPEEFAQAVRSIVGGPDGSSGQ